MDAEDMQEFMHEDGHTTEHYIPYYDEASAIYKALVEITGAEDFSQGGETLCYFYEREGGSETSGGVKPQEWKEISNRTGLQEWYVKAVAREYCTTNGMNWEELRG